MSRCSEKGMLLRDAYFEPNTHNVIADMVLKVDGYSRQIWRYKLKWVVIRLSVQLMLGYLLKVTRRMFLVHDLYF